MFENDDDINVPKMIRAKMDAMHQDDFWKTMRLKVMSADKLPVSSSLEVFNQFIRSRGNIIRQTTIGWYWASTVFLPTDHNFGFESDESIHFETMVFNRKTRKRLLDYGGMLTHGEELEQDRYHTYEQALKGHAQMVVKYRKIWNKRLKRLYAHM